MGVKWLLAFHPASGRIAAATDEDVLVKGLESLNCTRAQERKWETKCQLVRQNQAPDRLLSSQQGGLQDMWLVQPTELADTCFLVSRPDHQVLEADTSMLTLLQQRLDYKVKSYVTFEGRRWALGDFQFRILSASHVSGTGASFLGHALEIEYLPVMHRSMATPVMREIMDLIEGALESGSGRLELVEPSFTKYSLPEKYANMHTAIQYAELSVHILGMSHR